MLYACKGAYTLFGSQREREKEGGGGERERERVFIVKMNDGCLGTFSFLVRKELLSRINKIYYRRLLRTSHDNHNK